MGVALLVFMYDAVEDFGDELCVEVGATGAAEGFEEFDGFVHGLGCEVSKGVEGEV